MLVRHQSDAVPVKYLRALARDGGQHKPLPFLEARVQDRVLPPHPPLSVTFLQLGLGLIGPSLLGIGGRPGETEAGGGRIIAFVDPLHFHVRAQRPFHPFGEERSGVRGRGH